MLIEIWTVWLNGGPGCSSLIGLTTGNGPISFDGNSTRVVANPYSWTKFGHVLYVDQPVGTGYSTASQPYPAVNDDVVTAHFYSWLQSFFAHFPHLLPKQVHLMGESWAGIYIPHFATAIVNNKDSFPIRLRSMTIGDGSIGNGAAMATATIGTYLESQQSLLQIPDDALAVFKEADATCGFDDLLEQAAQYPPESKIYIPGNPEGLNTKRRRQQRMGRDLGDIYAGSCATNPTTAEEVRSSIYSSCYGPCATSTAATDYLSTIFSPCFDRYDISHDCSTVNSFNLVASYFSRPDVQIALNVLPSASTSPSVTEDSPDDTQRQTPSPFLSCNPDVLSTFLLNGQTPQAPVYSVLPTLITSHNISLHLYWGEYDILLNHFGAELVLQNMTWHGAQGFSSPITRPFYQDNAAPHDSDSRSSGSSSDNSNNDNNNNNNPGICAIHEAGKWISERGVTYHRFRGAGHSVFLSKPREMFAYVRDVVVASEN